MQTNSDQFQVFGMPATKGRWLFIFLGMLVLLCLGTVYSWSIFRKPLETLLNVGATESLLPFTVLLVLYATLMPIAGFGIDRFGPSTLVAAGGALMGVGYVVSSFANNITFLTLTYGVLAGAGIGIAYGVPLAVSARWFPDKKGLAVGLTVVGFGLSPLVTAPLAKSLIAAYDVQKTLLILGIVFTIVIVGISPFLKLPPKDWKPAGWTPPIVQVSLNSNRSEKLLKSRSFYGLWICYTIGTFVGLSAIGISSPVAQEIIKLDSGLAATCVSIFAIFNGMGRPLFGWLTDRLKPKYAAIIAYTLTLIAAIIMLNAQAGQVASYIVAFCLFWLSLGAWLAIAPTATLNLFQPDRYTQNYGIVFTAYGVGAFLGTVIVGQIRDVFGSYTYAFYPIIALSILGMFVALWLLKPSSAQEDGLKPMAAD